MRAGSTVLLAVAGAGGHDTGDVVLIDAAVDFAMKGMNAMMPVIQRMAETPYRWKVMPAKLEDIAKLKMPDLTAASLDAAVRTIAGSARSMGLTVEG